MTSEYKMANKHNFHLRYFIHAARLVEYVERQVA